jgi:hypothetical protein
MKKNERKKIHKLREKKYAYQQNLKEEEEAK